MLHIPNSAGENSLTETENDTLCLKSDKICELQKYNSEEQSRRGPLCFCFFSKPLIYVFSRNAHNQDANPLARPLLIAVQVVRTSFGFHLRDCMKSSAPPPPSPPEQILDPRITLHSNSRTHDKAPGRNRPDAETTGAFFSVSVRHCNVYLITSTIDHTYMSIVRLSMPWKDRRLAVFIFVRIICLKQTTKKQYMIMGHHRILEILTF